MWTSLQQRNLKIDTIYQKLLPHKSERTAAGVLGSVVVLQAVEDEAEDH